VRFNPLISRRKNIEAMIMTVRSSNTTVTFQRPFTIPSINGCHPAGTYRVFMEDEEAPGISFVASRRIATRLHIPALSMHPLSDTTKTRQVLSISAAELSAVIEHDHPPETYSARQRAEIRL
jgi:hypothetical protein